MKGRRKGIIMVIFATPDFGASGRILLFLLIVWAIVLLFVRVAIVLGIGLLGNESSSRIRGSGRGSKKVRGQIRHCHRWVPWRSRPNRRAGSLSQ